MRLSSCIAVELLVGASTLTALGVGSAWGVVELRAYLDRPAEVQVVAATRAASETARIGEAPDPPPIAVARVADPGPVAGGAPAPPVADDPAPAVAVGDPVGTPAWRRGGQSDADALAPLADSKITRVKFNRGGSSLSLRIDFANGARAAFKPEQIFPQSSPRREIAAYRVDRLLGLDRVPPALARSFTVDEVLAAAKGVPGAAGRLAKEARPKKGVLRGELSWWIPVIGDGRVGGFMIDSTDGIITWRRMLKPGGRIPEKDLPLVQQISDMTVFDFLIDNIDRWTGNNAKVSEDGSVLYFMDNTMAFTGNAKGHRKSNTYLSRVQTFSRRLIDRLRGLTIAELEDTLTVDVAPFDFLVTKKELKALIKRRDKLIAYVDELIAEHGEDKVLAFP